MLKAFEILNDAGKRTLERDILDLIARFNRSGDGTMVIPGAYLQVVVTKRRS